MAGAGPVVVPYDAGWPGVFERLRAELEQALQPWLVDGVHHVGSTAVPGLAAKPVIDMLAGVRDLEAARAAATPLAELGYAHREHRPEALLFTRPGAGVHLTEPGTDLWRERLAFRDALRADPGLAREYQAWKLAHVSPDPAARPYTADKRPFVERVLATRGVPLRPDETRLTPAALARKRRARDRRPDA